MIVSRPLSRPRAAGTRRPPSPASLLAIATLLAIVELLGLPMLLPGVAAATAPPRFVEVTDSGIDHVYDGGWEHFVGGGVATFDCNDDGYPELFFAGGSNPAALYENRSVPGEALRFRRLEASGLELTHVTGGYPLDIDADGITDLVVLRVGENLLMRGLGGCRFARANERWGFDGGHSWSTAFSATWERDGPHDGNGLPTLAIGNYVDRDDPDGPFGACDDNQLYRPRPDSQGYLPPLALTPSYCTLSLLFSDWDRSGRRDLFVSNDRHYYLSGNGPPEGSEQLWRMTADGPVLYTEADGWEPLRIWGMGIAGADLTGDGYPEYLLSSMGDNKLRGLAQAGPSPADGRLEPRYQDLAFAVGVTAHRPFSGGDLRPSTAWHPVFADVNNDGLLDLFLTKGNVEAMAEAAERDPNNLLLGQPDGSFREAADAAGLLSFARGRGAAVVDLDLDGLLDVVVVNRGAPAQLWHNLGSGTAAPEPLGHWLALQLRQPGGNRNAIGAWLELRSGDRVQQLELTSGGGHAGGSLGWLHVGLGEADAAELQVQVRVQWPDGAIGPWQQLAADGFYLITRDRAEATRWTPAQHAGWEGETATRNGGDD